MLVERLGHRGQEGLGQAELAGVEGGQGLIDDLVDEAHGGVGLEGPPAREDLVEDHPHRPHVGAGVHLGALEKLRRDVARGAQHHARLRQVRVAEPGDPEIEDLHDPVGRDEDVGGLHVPMDDAHLVGEVEAAAHVDDHPDLLLEGEAAGVVDGPAELLAVDELHGDVAGGLALAVLLDLADLEDGDDVRVVELRRRPGLALESLDRILPPHQGRRDHLERHRPVEERVVGLVDLPHGPLAELGQVLELSELLPQLQGHL
jgi:hypothetical protein